MAKLTKKQKKLAESLNPGLHTGIAPARSPAIESPTTRRRCSSTSGASG